ncbi:hypothetical protein DRH29_03445, partial [candidate division Kazan bacterium]
MDFANLKKTTPKRFCTTQGCPVLPHADVVQDVAEIHAVFEQLQTRVFHVVSTKDVEGKASKSGEDMGVGSDARLIFPHSDISDIMVSILNSPMIS